MKRFAPIGLLLLLLGAPAIICAQDDTKPPKQEDAKPEDKPKADNPKGDEVKPKDVKPENRDDMKPQDAKPQDLKPGEARHDDARPQEHPDNARPEQAHDAGRPAGKRVSRIPDDKFRASFGREHTTVINQTVIVGGHPSFQYGGYWFGISQAWPGGWAYTDTVYIDYIDGEYFLFDMLHPGVRIALIVTM